MNPVMLTPPSSGELSPGDGFKNCIVDDEWKALCLQINATYAAWIARKDVDTHILPIEGHMRLHTIATGIQKYEVRIFGPECKKLTVSDHLLLFDKKIGLGVQCKISSLDIYYHFEEMLHAKGILNLLPQLKEAAHMLSYPALLTKGAEIFRNTSGFERIHPHGVVAIGLEFMRYI